MKILLTGADGQVGWELRRTLAPLGEVLAFPRGDLDLSDPAALRECVRTLKPEIIANAAAYTAVDRAEAEEAVAHRINADAPGIFAEEAERLGAWLVHYSTDYVFDGSKPGPYVEDDPPNPLNAYGRTKLAGERAVAAVGGRHLIFRTTWVYANRGRNFYLTMLRLAAERNELRVVDDQRGAPTWARLIAEGTALALMRVLADGAQSTRLSGLYHLTCGGAASWHEFAEAIFGQSKLARRPKVLPIRTAEYPTPARRPLNSLLSSDRASKVFGIGLPAWDFAFRMCCEERGGSGI